MAIDPEGTARLQEQFAKGLAHMVEHPVDALGNMIDIKDLQSGDYAKWLRHLTPDVIVTVLTMGGGGAAAAAGEGVARTAGEETVVEAALAAGTAGVEEGVPAAAAQEAGESAGLQLSAKAGAGTSPMPAIDETAKALTEPEREIARMLQAEGRQVTAVAEGRLRTPDVLVDGEPTEFKSLGPGRAM